MNATKIVAAMVCSSTLWVTGALAQMWNRCDPRYYFITPANCTTYGEQAAKHMAEMRIRALQQPG